MFFKFKRIKGKKFRRIYLIVYYIYNEWSIIYNNKGSVYDIMWRLKL